MKLQKRGGNLANFLNLMEIIVTNINESADTLDITNNGNWFDKITHLIVAAMFLPFGAVLLVFDHKPTADAQYPKFAPIVGLIIGIVLLFFGTWFLSKVFESNSYYFDKTADKFYLKGRRDFFKKWAVEGAVSDITGVSYQIFGQDEKTYSEIFLTYRFYASVTETAKCGTGDEVEDDIITTHIKNFIEPEKIK
ncbi:MAG: hypothetical protein ABI891_10330 [Acidobacteriota bacterium]